MPLAVGREVTSLGAGSAGQVVARGHGGRVGAGGVAGPLGALFHLGNLPAGCRALG